MATQRFGGFSVFLLSAFLDWNIWSLEGRSLGRRVYRYRPTLHPSCLGRTGILINAPTPRFGI